MVAFTSNGKLPEWRWVYAVYGFVPWVVWFVVCLLPVQIVYKDGAVKVEEKFGKYFGYLH